MQPLSNLKHEKFCQLVAAGMRADEAYKEAGYVPNPNNARRLRAKPAVKQRIEALIREASDRALDENARTIRQIGYSKLDAMMEAESALRLARETKNAAATVSAVKLRAQLNNLLVERREVTQPTTGKTLEEHEAWFTEQLMRAGATREQAEKVVGNIGETGPSSKPH